MIERAVRLIVGYFRYQCGLRLAPVWDLDDVRQAAALHYLESGDINAAARATWAEFRRNRYYLRFQNPGIPDEIEADDRRPEPIPEMYFEKCSERERAALVFAYEADMCGDEIAEMLGITRKAANLLLVRGRKKVKAVV